MRTRPQYVRRLLAAPLAGLLLLASCGYDATEVPKADQTEESSGGGGGSTAPECDNATQSYAPSNDAAAARRELANNGRLVVGVSADTLKLGSANPFKNSQIEGFDIDVANAIAEALGVKVQLRVINAAQRIPLLESGEIDIVARNFTINCARWEEIAFSGVYYNATQKVLVRKDAEGEWEKYAGPKDLAGLRVCAPAGSTSIANITRIEPDAIAVAAANHTGCLTKFQNSEVEAITGDDTVLAGLAAQDPYAVVPEQEKLTDEPYGIGLPKDDKALRDKVNDILETALEDGRPFSCYHRIIDRNIGVWSNNAHSQTSVAITSSDTTTYVAWQDSRNGNALTNVEDIYFATVQHAAPVTESDDADDDVPGWVLIGASAAVGMGITVLVALAVGRRRRVA